MFGWLDTLDIDTLGRLFNRPVNLLDDHRFLANHPTELRRIKRQRRRCTLVGHMWEVETYDRPRNTFHLKCARCFPHIDSRQAVVSYAPFSTVERKTD